MCALLPPAAWSAQAGSRWGRSVCVALQRILNSAEVSLCPEAGTSVAVPLPARVRFFPRVGPSQPSHATPKGLSVLAELACGKFSIRLSGPPLGAHYGSSRQRRLSVLERSGVSCWMFEKVHAFCYFLIKRQT